MIAHLGSLVVVLVAGSSCAKREGEPSDEPATTKQSAGAGAGPLATGAAGAGDPADRHACDILTIELVTSTLGVAALDAKGKPQTTATYTSCTLVWPSDKKVERQIAGQTVTVDAENRITLSVSIFQPGNDRETFDAGIRYLKEKYESQPVEGVGEEAVWIPVMKQLSVRGKGQVFHLSVKYADGDRGDLEHTKEVATRLLGTLG